MVNEILPSHVNNVHLLKKLYMYFFTTFLHVVILGHVLVSVMSC